ncbi:hypothetical protein [Kineococcus arenarius]|uniref:hypothetical protein n=1 Tax=unclassified Kineococcus TaxID=2621656 RepID=UPI003D7ED1C4
MRGLAAAAAGWFGREPVLRRVGWEVFHELAGEHAQASWEHLSRSHIASTAKARGELDLAGQQVPRTA